MNHRKYGFTDINHFEAINGKNVNIEDMYKKGELSLRALFELRSKIRFDHAGLGSLGAIGCALSHYSLWKLCIELDLPYMIICEEDNNIDSISTDNIKLIQEILERNGMFVSSKVRTMKNWGGSYMYFISKDACKTLIKYFYPIDVQLDWYLNYLGKLKSIEIDGFPISKHNPDKPSGTQSSKVSCHRNQNSRSTEIINIDTYYYSLIALSIFAGLLLICIIVLSVMYYKLKSKVE